MPIPKIIHHVWPGNDPFKEKFHAFRNTWMVHHPDWTFYFWRINNFPSEANVEIISALNDPKYSITPKSDIMRFEIVRLFGGIYVDTDMECLKPFDNFLDHEIFSGYEDGGSTICPSLFGAVPNHPVINAIAELSIKNAKINGYDKSNKQPNIVTGVVPFTRVLKQHSHNENIKIYNKNYFYHIGYEERHRLNETHPEAYAKHHWTGKDPDGWTRTTRFVD